MNLQNRVHQMLKEIPWTRERLRKDEAIVKLLTNKKQWDGNKTVFTLQELTDLAKDFDSANRYWRLLTARHTELQGRDYKDKIIYEQRKILDLDYEMGYNSLSRLSKNL